MKFFVRHETGQEEYLGSIEAVLKRAEFPYSGYRDDVQGTYLDVTVTEERRDEFLSLVRPYRLGGIEIRYLKKIWGGRPEELPEAEIPEELKQTISKAIVKILEKFR